MPPKGPSIANQTSVQKKRRIAESQRFATVHISNSQATTSSLPIASTGKDVSGSQHLSTLRYEDSHYIFTFTQYLLTCNERQTNNHMSDIHHTPAGRVGRGREAQGDQSSILGQEHLGKSSIYISVIHPFVKILVGNVKMIEATIIMILLIQQAL
jgi:hypothetical protein